MNTFLSNLAGAASSIYALWGMIGNDPKKVELEDELHRIRNDETSRDHWALMREAVESFIGDEVYDKLSSAEKTVAHYRYVERRYEDRLKGTHARVKVLEGQIRKADEERAAKDKAAGEQRAAADHARAEHAALTIRQQREELAEVQARDALTIRQQREELAEVRSKLERVEALYEKQEETLAEVRLESDGFKNLWGEELKENANLKKLLAIPGVARTPESARVAGKTTTSRRKRS
jgi:hypothetical protein